MTDYIEREAAIADLELYETQVVRSEYALAIAGCRSHIRNLPAADVRPVVKATWEQVEVRYEDELIDNPVQAVASMFCPNCQRYHNEVYFYGMPTERVNFCPNCGADCRGDKDGE